MGLRARMPSWKTAESARKAGVVSEQLDRHPSDGRHRRRRTHARHARQSSIACLPSCRRRGRKFCLRPNEGPMSLLTAWARTHARTRPALNCTNLSVTRLASNSDGTGYLVAPAGQGPSYAKAKASASRGFLRPRCSSASTSAGAGRHRQQPPPPESSRVESGPDRRLIRSMFYEKRGGSTAQAEQEQSRAEQASKQAKQGFASTYLAPLTLFTPSRNATRPKRGWEFRPCQASECECQCGPDSSPARPKHDPDSAPRLADQRVRSNTTFIEPSG